MSGDNTRTSESRCNTTDAIRNVLKAKRQPDCSPFTAIIRVGGIVWQPFNRICKSSAELKGLLLSRDMGSRFLCRHDVTKNRPTWFLPAPHLLRLQSQWTVAHSLSISFYLLETADHKLLVRSSAGMVTNRDIEVMGLELVSINRIQDRIPGSATV